MTQDELWHAYVAGFFDGEGSIGISIARQTVYSDEYRLRVELAQRVEYRDILDRVCAEFGGLVKVRRQSTKNARWADIALWWAVKRSDVRLFLTTLLPHLVVKRERAVLALAYLDLVDSQKRHSMRSCNKARWTGASRLTADELSARETFRQQMLLLNRFGNHSLSDNK